MKPMIQPAQMCHTHQALLVQQAGIPESGPWRSFIIGAQIALFQAASADPQTHERIGDDITRIGELGCLACYKPDAFGEVVEAAKSGDLGQVKALGERWVQEGARHE